MKEKKTKIKICGLTRPEEIRWILEENVDYFGIVLFFPKSRRNNSIENAGKLLAVCREECEKKQKRHENFITPVAVAVTVSPTLEQIREIENAGFDMIQIHEELSKEVLSVVSIPIIRAFRATDIDIEKQFEDCPKIAAYLFDAQTPGSGQTFDWELLPDFIKNGFAAADSTTSDRKLIFLAGGLNGGNVRAAIQKVHPDVVDVSSGVERSSITGGSAVMKDREKIREFIRKVRTDE